MIKQRNKNNSIKEMQKLFNKLDLSKLTKQVEDLKKLRKLSEQNLKISEDTWIVSDVSSNFPSFNLKK